MAAADPVEFVQKDDGTWKQIREEGDYFALLIPLGTNNLFGKLCLFYVLGVSGFFVLFCFFSFVFCNVNRH